MKVENRPIRTQLLIKWSRLATMGLWVVVLTACGGDDDDGQAAPDAARFVNGISDSTNLTAFIYLAANSNPETIPFGAASPIEYVPDGTFSAELTPDQHPEFAVSNITISPGTITTIFGAGQVTNNTQTGFAAIESLKAPDSGTSVVQLVNAAFQATEGNPTATLAFTGPGGTFTADGPHTTATFGQSASLYSMANGSYEFVIEVGGSVVFDSGPGGITLPGTNGANVFQIAILDSTADQMSTYGSPITVLLLDNAGGATPVYNVQPASTD